MPIVMESDHQAAEAMVAPPTWDVIANEEEKPSLIGDIMSGRTVIETASTGNCVDAEYETVNKRVRDSGLRPSRGRKDETSHLLSPPISGHSAKSHPKSLLERRTIPTLGSKEQRKEVSHLRDSLKNLRVIINRLPPKMIAKHTQAGSFSLPPHQARPQLRPHLHPTSPAEAEVIAQSSNSPCSPAHSTNPHHSASPSTSSKHARLELECPPVKVRAVGEFEAMREVKVNKKVRVNKVKAHKEDRAARVFKAIREVKAKKNVKVKEEVKPAKGMKATGKVKAIEEVKVKEEVKFNEEVKVKEEVKATGEFKARRESAEEVKAKAEVKAMAEVKDVDKVKAVPERHLWTALLSGLQTPPANCDHESKTIEDPDEGTLREEERDIGASGIKESDVNSQQTVVSSNSLPDKSHKRDNHDRGDVKIPANIKGLLDGLTDMAQTDDGVDDAVSTDICETDNVSEFISIPAAVTLLKTMQMAVQKLKTEVTEKRTAVKRSTDEKPSTSRSQSMSTDMIFDLKPKTESPFKFEDISDDELPDLDSPVGPSPMCSCQSTSGRAVLMCQICRVGQQFDEPLCKKPKKDRHFLDVISVTPKLHTPKVGEDSDSIESLEVYGKDGCFNLEQLHVPGNDEIYMSDSSLESVELYPKRRQDSMTSLESVRPYPEIDKPSSVVLDSQSSVVSGSESEVEEDSVSHRVVRGKTRNVDNDEVPIDSRKITRRLSDRPCYFSKGLHVDMIFHSETDTPMHCHVVKMSEPRMNIIDGVLDEAAGVQEEADAYGRLLHHVVQLVKDFTTTTTEPPDTVIRELLKILINSEDSKLSCFISSSLTTILRLHPPTGIIPFEWSDLEEVMIKLRLPYGIRNLPMVTALSNSLALQIICSFLETELLHRSLASQLRVIRSVAFKWLSAEISFGHVKQVISWITQALLYGEYEDILSSVKKLSLDREQSFSQPVPKVLPSLQKLLDLSISVSKRPEECARRISIELVHMFRYLPSLQARRLFLTTLSSPLLRFTLAQRLLEDQCGADSCGALCLQDLVSTDFKVDPPRNSLTPPPTPSSDDDDEAADEDRPLPRPLVPFNDEGWEELTLLLWTVVSSYLATVKANLRYPLWKRVLEDSPCRELDARDKKTLLDMPTHVAKLRNRIESATPMSNRISIYLIQLECLADI